MDGSSIPRLYCASCVLHLVVLVPCVIRVLRLLRALRVLMMCLSLRLWGRLYGATRAARFAHSTEPIVDVVGGPMEESEEPEEDEAEVDDGDEKEEEESE